MQSKGKKLASYTSYLELGPGKSRKILFPNVPENNFEFLGNFGKIYVLLGEISSISLGLGYIPVPGNDNFSGNSQP